jgi:hypothetical protein
LYLSGDGNPYQGFILQETGMESASVRAIPVENFFRRRNEDGELFPNREFPITSLDPMQVGPA